MHRLEPLAAILLTGVTLAQTPEVSIRITSPASGVHISGPTLLEAVIEPGSRAHEVERVRFFVDGQVACTAADPARAACTWDAGRRLTAHVIRAVADRKTGGRVVASTRTTALHDREAGVTVDVVQITAVVSDNGRFVPDLPQHAFRLREDGVPQAISYFSAAGAPLEILVAVDVSASMAESMTQLKDAVRGFLSAVDTQDQVTVAAFNDHMFTLARRETTVAERLRAVDRLVPGGVTALHDVIIRGLGHLSRQSGRRVLVVFSDGDDRASRSTLETVKRAVRASDATLFIVALGRRTHGPHLAGIEALARLSGGRVIFERHDRLAAVFGEILLDLSNHYLIGFESSSPSREGTWHELTVDLPGYDYAVRARQGYRSGGVGFQGH